MPYFVYWIQSRRRAYIGATNDPVRRLRQHNGELKGGAWRTRGLARGRGDWRTRVLVSGFATWPDALSFEKSWQLMCRRCRGDASRRAKLDLLLGRWVARAELRVEDAAHD